MDTLELLWTSTIFCLKYELKVKMRYVNFICKYNGTMVNEKIPTHYYHSCKIIILAVLEGAKISKSYTIISHEMTTIILFLPSFRLFHHHLHAFTRKTYSA
jgi:hypothetical protein